MDNPDPCCRATTLGHRHREDDYLRDLVAASSSSPRRLDPRSRRAPSEHRRCRCLGRSAHTCGGAARG
ncbi:hypothetical protein E2562_035781 [Oryza meyeriana var. granulata]|uniref:Uncharacterized protein n=1 Tax=Oryza meyeriana var. granulata TaxID=110450 RepID=A0A6G1CL51_9ORYZ|nr:hypothetical protein E2562_035781 [Oryza meyeriana var. granulata]